MKNLWNKLIDMPPVWLVFFMIIAYVQTRVFNPLGFTSSGTNLAGWILIVLGFIVFGWSIALFRSHDTSIKPRNTPSAFIAQGPYKFSRNPIYLADAAILLGFILLQGSIIGIILVPIFMRVITVRFIVGEEAGLIVLFPDEFADFCRKTRRWI
ncbi:MAG: protein-S-isoprenylcysteine O-methyltransferase Ste14 [Planctomycetota bacterium]|jgi:protein-S-isoprenylcysteine O-methyltransferase Ste14